MTLADGELERRLERLETRLASLEEEVRSERQLDRRRQRDARRARIMLWIVVAAVYLGYLWYATGIL